MQFLGCWPGPADIPLGDSHRPAELPRVASHGGISRTASQASQIRTWGAYHNTRLNTPSVYGVGQNGLTNPTYAVLAANGIPQSANWAAWSGLREAAPAARV